VDGEEIKRGMMRVLLLPWLWAIAKTKQLLGEAGVAGHLVEVLKTHLQSAAVMEPACWALSNVAIDGEWRRMSTQW